MSKSLTAGGVFARWLFALVLVFATYNPTEYNYLSWILAEDTELGPVLAIVGLLLLIGWIIYLRATFLSMGWLGVTLGAALMGCLTWLLVDVGLLSLSSTNAITWVVLVILSMILAVGMSWSHIRRRLTGQIDVDEIED